ncbi:putative membrane protein [Nitrobacteraceae bacterium AZCC 2161]
MQHVRMTRTNFIREASPGSATKLGGQPILRMLVSFSAAYFAGAFVTDIAYWQMPDVLWERFSIWLITAGLIIAGLAAIAYVIGLAGGRQIDTPAWPRVIGYALAVLLSVINAFVHSRDGYTAVVPTGLMLSGLVVVVLLLTAWVAMTLANRRRVGG